MSVFFSKEHPIGFTGSVIIEKQYLIVKIARSNHSQVLKNPLNDDELYEIHFIRIWKKYLRLVRAASDYSRNKVVAFMNFPYLTSLFQRQNAQKQPFAAVFQNRYFALRTVFKKVAGLQDCNFVKKRPQHRCFPVNIGKTFYNIFIQSTPLTASEFVKSLFTYWLRINIVIRNR